jgi:hypothetical protein
MVNKEQIWWGIPVISTETFASLVDAIYEAGMDARQWPEILGRLAAACGASVAGLKLTDGARARFAMFSAAVDPAAIDAYNERFHRLDPIAAAVERKPAGTLVTDR